MNCAIQLYLEIVPVAAIVALAKSEKAQLFGSARLQRIPAYVLWQIGEYRARTGRRARLAQG